MIPIPVGLTMKVQLVSPSICHFILHRSSTDCPFFQSWKVGISWEVKDYNFLWLVQKLWNFFFLGEYFHGMYTIISFFKEETENVDMVWQGCWKTWKWPQIGQLCFFTHVHIILQALTQQMSSGRVSVRSSVVNSSFLSSIVHTRYSTLCIVILLCLSTSTP